MHTTEMKTGQHKIWNFLRRWSAVVASKQWLRIKSPLNLIYSKWGIKYCQATCSVHNCTNFDRRDQIFIINITISEIYRPPTYEKQITLITTMNARSKKNTIKTASWAALSLGDVLKLKIGVYDVYCVTSW